MASNGTQQSQLYAMRGGISDGNSQRNRSVEQYYGGSGNPQLPMFNTGAGGQAYGYNRYIPPMMQSWNGGWNTPQTGAGNPYSYNTPNSYGSNYMGGNYYQPMGVSQQYGGGGPLPAFGGQAYGGPQGNSFGQYGQQPGFWGNNSGWMAQGQMGGQRSPYQQPPQFSQYGGQQGGFGSYKPYQEGQGTIGPSVEAQQFSNPYSKYGEGARYGRRPANPDQQAPMIPRWAQMGY